MLIWGIYLLAIPGYNLSQSLIFYDRKIFRQILRSPTIGEYRDKILLRKIQTGEGVQLLHMKMHRLNF